MSDDFFNSATDQQIDRYVIGPVLGFHRNVHVIRKNLNLLLSEMVRERTAPRHGLSAPIVHIEGEST